MKTKHNTSFNFSDIAITPMSCLNEIIFCPSLNAFENVESLDEAKAKMIVLANMVFYEKFLIMPCDINGKQYVLFYSPKEEIFSCRRIFVDKISDITVYKHDEFHISVFMGRELEALCDKTKDAYKYLKLEKSIGKNQKIIVVLDYLEIEDKVGHYTYALKELFKNVEAVMFIDENDIRIEKQERAFLLC